MNTETYQVKLFIYLFIHLFYHNFTDWKTIENVLDNIFIVVNIPVTLMELFYFIYHEKYCIDHEITNITTINSPYSIFYELLEKFRPFITKKTTNMRSPVSAEEKLAITLRHLATAESLNSLRCQLHVHETTIRKFITRVCEAICKVLASDYMNCPSTKQEWEYIVDQTNSR